MNKVLLVLQVLEIIMGSIAELWKIVNIHIYESINYLEWSILTARHWLKVVDSLYWLSLQCTWATSTLFCSVIKISRMWGNWLQEWHHWKEWTFGGVRSLDKNIAYWRHWQSINVIIIFDVHQIKYHSLNKA